MTYLSLSRLSFLQRKTTHRSPLPIIKQETHALTHPPSLLLFCPLDGPQSFVLQNGLLIVEKGHFHSRDNCFEMGLLNQLNSTVSIKYEYFCRICDKNSGKFDLSSTFDLEVAFHMCRI